LTLPIDLASNGGLLPRREAAAGTPTCNANQAETGRHATAADPIIIIRLTHLVRHR
jgi:hypothetical protein